MARINDSWLLQQIGTRIVLFQEGTEIEIVNYDVSNTDDMTTASKIIDASELFSAEEKGWAHFWMGYLYASQI